MVLIMMRKREKKREIVAGCDEKASKKRAGERERERELKRSGMVPESRPIP